jgi:zinc protease
MYDRSYRTVNRLFRTYAALTGDDLVAAARRYFTDERLVVTTLSKDLRRHREGARARLPHRRDGGRERRGGPPAVPVIAARRSFRS